MITWLFIDHFPEDTDPVDIWLLFGFEVLVEVSILSLVIAFFRMFVFI